VRKRLTLIVANLLIAAGIVVAGFVVYEVAVSNWISQAETTAAATKLESTFKTKRVDVVPKKGEAFALITIPRLGEKVNSLPVIEGIDQSDLAKGVGHYPGTALPGEIGNFAVAGHRATHGEPFAKFEELRAGDQVLVETATATFVYELTEDTMVKPKGTWVIDDVPGEPLVEPTQRLLTLTSCEPRWNATKRWIWWGVLVEKLPKT
jgi:sortase A